MDSEKILEEIGLSKNEAKVYLALLQSETSAAGDIAHKTGLHRANVYDSLTQLEGKGLVSSNVTNQTKQFIARKADSLLEFVRGKQQLVEQLIPKLNALTTVKEPKHNLYITEGLFAVKEAINDLILGGEELMVYGFLSEVPEELLGFLNAVNDERIKQMVPVRMISTSGGDGGLKTVSIMRGAEARTIESQKSTEGTPTVRKVTRLLSGNKCIVFIWSKPVLVISMENPSVAQFYKEEFEFLWTHAKVL